MNSRDLATIVRRKMKSQGETLKTFSKKLRVSEPTLKRWLNGQGLNLEQWAQMLSLLDLSLIDVAAEIGTVARTQFEYTEKQEHAFVRVPGLLAFFQALLEGSAAAEITRSHSLTKKSTAFYLRRLDDIGLIKWNEGVRLLKKGEPRWRRDGELTKAFRAKVFDELVYANLATAKLSLYHLSSVDRAELEKKVDELMAFARSAERRARASGLRTANVGLAVTMNDYKPDFLFTIPNVR